MFHFDKLFSQNLPAWDFRWVYSVYINNGLCITPNVNLITNVGFGTDALHASNSKDRYANMANYEMEEIRHPQFFIPEKNADVYTLKNHLRYSVKGIIEKIIVKSSEKFQSFGFLP